MTVKLTDRLLTSRKPPVVGRAIYTEFHGTGPSLPGERHFGT
jgi:hypothetical protein